MQSDEARHKLDITQTYIGYKCKMSAAPNSKIHKKATLESERANGIECMNENLEINRKKGLKLKTDADISATRRLKGINGIIQTLSKLNDNNNKANTIPFVNARMRQLDTDFVPYGAIQVDCRAQRQTTTKCTIKPHSFAM